MIQFQSVSKSFGEKKVLNQISFETKEQEILFVIGKSGAGKSVTLKCTVGLLTPDSGTIEVDGERVDPTKAPELEQIRKKCGMIFQKPALIDSMTAFENVSFGIMDLDPDQRSKRIQNVFDLLELSSDFYAKKPTEISFGIQKKISIARAIVLEPQILLWDEPTTSLDPESKWLINSLVKKLSNQLKVTSIVVSHDMDCAFEIADRILVLDQAEIAALDTPSAIKKSSHPMIREFVKEIDSL